MLSCVVVWHWLQCVDMQLLCISCKAAADMLLHRPQKQGQRSKKGAEDELLSASGLQFDNKQLLCPRKLRPGRLKCVSMQQGRGISSTLQHSTSAGLPPSRFMISAAHVTLLGALWSQMPGCRGL